MLNGKTIAFVGSGNMAKAMIGGLLAKKLITPNQVLAIGPRKARGHELSKEYPGIRTSTKNSDAVKADIVVLSFKPKPSIREKVFTEIRKGLKEETLIISIMAGVSIQTIVQGLGVHNVIRCMPNTPGRIRKGITGWTANGIQEAQLKRGRQIIGALGKEIFFEDEQHLHTVTGVSGTGPAYILLIMEAMIATAVERGMSRNDAVQLVLHTFRGTAEHALRSKQHLAELRDQVTSPGGTTAAALYAMEKGGLRTVIADGIHAACDKSIELGKK